MQTEEITESEAQLLKVIHTYRVKNEQLLMSLRAIAAMKLSPVTDFQQLTALCIAIAETTLEVVA